MHVNKARPVRFDPHGSSRISAASSHEAHALCSFQTAVSRRCDVAGSPEHRAKVLIAPTLPRLTSSTRACQHLRPHSPLAGRKSTRARTRSSIVRLRLPHTSLRAIPDPFLPFLPFLPSLPEAKACLLVTAFPRLVTHVDEAFLAAVTSLYKELIPAGGDVLDLMSSWVSHLPKDVQYNRVVGHGMNAVELGRNRRLDSFFVRDLNRDPDGWAAADASYDAVLCCVSVQYLQRPERVFAEIYRVLKPGGVCIITFSNRLYYEKAVQAWRDCGNDYGRIQLVKQYFTCIEGFTAPEALRKMPAPVEKQGLGALFSAAKNMFQTIQQDPFYAVISYKDRKP